MESDILTKKLMNKLKKLNIDINQVIDDVIENTCHETKSKKKFIKYNIVLLINLIIVFISYMKCCNNKNVMDNRISNIEATNNTK